MPLGQLKTKEEIIAACKQQVIAATLICTDAAKDAYSIEQDRIEEEYRKGAPAGYPPSRLQAGFNKIACEGKSPYGCPNPSGYPNLAEEARGRAYCQACLDQYLKETGDLEEKRSRESSANDRKRLDAIKKCDDKRAQLLSDCINGKPGVIPSSPTTAPIVPVPTSPVRLYPSGMPRPPGPVGRPRDVLDDAMDERWRLLDGPIPM